MKKIIDICYTGDGNPSRMLDVYLPETDTFRVFLYFHGGGLEAGDKGFGNGVPEYLTDRGIALVSANYRMYPEAKYPEFLEDGAAAAKWVLDNMPQYGKVTATYLGGSSAGGYMSLMLCFDPRYLRAAGVEDGQISGYLHDAGQPTTHFNVLRERGVDTRRVIVDEASPMYFIGTQEKLPPMVILVSDGDMENRPEQTALLMSTLRHFRYDMSRILCHVQHGGHCQYCGTVDPDGLPRFGKLIVQAISEMEAMA